MLAPKHIWGWLSYYLEDQEQVVIQEKPKKIAWTVGKLCRELLNEQKFCGSMLPRIPVPIAKEISENLREWDRTHKKEKKKKSPRRARSRSPDRRYRGRQSSRERESYSKKEESVVNGVEYDEFGRIKRK